MDGTTIADLTQAGFGIDNVLTVMDHLSSFVVVVVVILNIDIYLFRDVYL